jgi:hypothetical protein
MSSAKVALRKASTFRFHSTSWRWNQATTVRTLVGSHWLAMAARN